MANTVIIKVYRNGILKQRVKAKLGQRFVYRHGGQVVFRKIIDGTWDRFDITTSFDDRNAYSDSGLNPLPALAGVTQTAKDIIKGVLG